jgi:hypothetical protein
MPTANATTVRYSRRPLPAVYDAALELHLWARECLKTTGAAPSGIAPIHRATRRACVAIFVAAHGPAHHLRRAREALLNCLGLLAMLRGEGAISGGFRHEAERRIDQILEGMDQLARFPPEEWADLKLAELNAIDPEGAAADDLQSARMDSIVKRVVDAVKLRATVAGAEAAAGAVANSKVTRTTASPGTPTPTFLRKRGPHQKAKQMSVRG